MPGMAYQPYMAYQLTLSAQPTSLLCITISRDKGYDVSVVNNIIFLEVIYFGNILGIKAK